MSAYDEYKVDVPEGRSGQAVIKRFNIGETESMFTKMRMYATGSAREFIETGTYTRLSVNGQLWMTDTPTEVREHHELFHKANGLVLLNGMGLGMALQFLLKCDRVEEVWVTEINQDVLNLVADHYYKMATLHGKGLRIIEEDALTFTPPKGQRFGFVWHDIWPDICEDNIEQMKSLHRRYGRRTDAQASWSRPQIEARRRQQLHMRQLL